AFVATTKYKSDDGCVRRAEGRLRYSSISIGARQDFLRRTTHPVTCVNWNEATSIWRASHTYRLPSERKATVAVDAFAPNPWGLYNIRGNVFEWMASCWTGSMSDFQSQASHPLEIVIATCSAGTTALSSHDLRVALGLLQVSGRTCWLALRQNARLSVWNAA